MNRDDYKKLWDKIIHFVDEFRRNPKPESLQEVMNYKLWIINCVICIPLGMHRSVEHNIATKTCIPLGMHPLKYIKIYKNFNNLM